ncbi:hypothetical protein [Mucilaginibacter sp. FT3.2]|uniref:hypothetical protein n=1 Tax=Mucilaginibacter sp. FT3.2 TaxID=2723090 RepID=UPI0016186BE6|nr:hypothetical protein [Mucilaginibacter sp. FT3.2]MBB6234661.1 hypothetical protein [Mucilaginibacter sp. FT3.2]
MNKHLLLLILGAFFIATGYCQKRDSIFYYDGAGFVVNATDNFAFVRVISLHPDTDGLYLTKEYYKGGQIKIVGKSTLVKNYFKAGEVSWQGPYVSYFLNGHRQCIGTSNNNWNTGDATYYYPNGKVYCIQRYRERNNSLLITCYDTAGNIIAENGKGHWLLYYKGFKKVRLEGPIVNSLPNGTWQGHIIDSTAITSISKFEVKYKDGLIDTVESYGHNGMAHTVKLPFVFPEYKYDLFDFIKNVKRDLKTEANVDYNQLVISFIVEKDGSINDIVFADYSDSVLNEKLVKAMQKYNIWKPGTFLAFNMRYRMFMPLAIQRSNGVTKWSYRADLLCENPSLAGNIIVSMEEPF